MLVTSSHSLRPLKQISNFVETSPRYRSEERDIYNPCHIILCESYTVVHWNCIKVYGIVIFGNGEQLFSNELTISKSGRAITRVNIYNQQEPLSSVVEWGQNQVESSGVKLIHGRLHVVETRLK